ncbi:AAA ATPase domain-containing protein [Nocardioides scoriae]|uniref:AAA ATPase domain-containing protein n=1 Tax=Nocardioides scoriae TaxID=642780 RepID=A0A1H1PP30_9ACTN|nr:4-amino-4-deoxy-L-arabinose transferase [Nocardioides scoriae]SDS12898.1 AAA ATPase domain-containing protein [Nocardioides scoriae]
MSAPPGREALPAVLDALAAAAPTLGTGRLLCVDGPAGSGKTTLAGRVAAAVPGAVEVHTDDLLQGWSGLAGLAERLEELLRPLASGRPGRYRRWDWLADAWAETVVVDPAPLLVVEGVGSGAARCADLTTLLVWVEAPHDLRMRRGLERDGEAFAPHWERWARDEQDLFDREQTRERAQLRVDGRDGTVQP